VRAQRIQVRSQMLPQISASTGETVMQLNLASYGFTSLSTAIPAIIGPFQYMQLHATFEHRWDLRAAEVQQTAAGRAFSAARAEHLPSISFSGYYGISGTHPNQSHGDFAAQGTINVPIFTGGKISGDIRQAQANMRLRQFEYADQKAKVEQDVRSALVQLRVAAG
jgi:hypothetical protein